MPTSALCCEFVTFGWLQNDIKYKKILDSLTFIAMTTTDIKNQVAENRKEACVKQ